jgi:two-component system, LuxR family, response regulator FixJ
VSHDAIAHKSMKLDSINHMRARAEIPTIYLIDDDDAVRDSLDVFLTLKGLCVVAFSSGLHLLDGELNDPNLLILDVNLPELDGFSLLEALRGRGCDAPAVFITGLGNPEVRAKAERAGAAAFFDKPIDAPVLYEAVADIIAGGPQASRIE